MDGRESGKGGRDEMGRILLSHWISRCHPCTRAQTHQPRSHDVVQSRCRVDLPLENEIHRRDVRPTPILLDLPPMDEE